MITRQQLDQLSQFKNGQYLVTSCYLNLDRTPASAQTVKIRLKDLMQGTEHERAGKAESHVLRESLRSDFQRIESFVTESTIANRCKALAMFSCAGEKFWQAYSLPRAVRDRFVIHHEVYLRPLEVILAEHHRFCVVLTDRVRGQLFELYMGEILEHTTQLDPVPRRVREGGFQGREERHIERHHDRAVHEHFARLADSAFALFQRDRFDWLILGGHPNVLAEFKEHLHSYLRERWVGDLAVEPGHISIADVRDQCLEIERRIEDERKSKLAGHLVQAVQMRGLAVAGLKDSLAALMRGEVQTLMVEDEFQAPGFHCRYCRFLSADAESCPQCARATESCADIVDEAVGFAMDHGCGIEHLHAPTQLREAGRVGALLRYHSG